MLLYRLLSILFFPFIGICLYFRRLRGKENYDRFKERFGITNIKRKDGFLLWIHCASVGESNSAIPLVNKILDEYKHINILFTSGTVTSAIEIGKKTSSRVTHQFIPVDTYFSVKGFLNHWKPNLAIFFESELWPNLIIESKRLGCNLILANARLALESYRKWWFISRLGFNILNQFSLILCQSEKDKQLLQNFNVSSVKFLGNLKSIYLIPQINQVEFNRLKKVWGKRKIWVAASTHNGEDAIIIDVHKQLKEYIPNLLTIIVPRHINRTDKIKSLIPKSLNYSIRSQFRKMCDNDDIYIVNTMGELSLFYKLADISLICGSLVKNIGGHNPFEAISMGSAVLSGKFVDNFKESYEMLEKSNACIFVNNKEDIIMNLLKLFQDESLLKNMILNGSSIVKNNSNILNNTLDEIAPYIEI